MFDRIIAALSPEWALRRARARHAHRGLSALYDGATTTRRTKNWRAERRGPNSEVRQALKTLRDRSRDLVRNNPFAAAGLDLVVAYQVGAGIMPRSNTGDEGLDKQVDALWTEWAAQADVTGRTDAYGLQALLARSRGESGEGIAILTPLSAAEARRRNMRVPLAIQVVEPDHLDETFDGGTAPGQSPYIRQGIEFDATFRPVAYHLHQRHPGETDGLFGPGVPIQRQRVPADRVIHLFRQDRAGQIRGVPDLAPVMTRLRSLDELEDAALEQAKVQACLAAMIISQAGPARGPLEGGDLNDAAAAEDGYKTLYPGMMERLLPGEDVKFLTPSGTGGFNDLARHQLHAIATGWGITYDLLTGDLSQANYSSLRAGRLAFKRRLERVQWHVLIPGMCEPIWNAFVRAAMAAGVLEIRAEGYPVAWSCPAFEMVDPLKDAMAVKEALRLGLLTWGQAVAQMGWEPRAQAAEIARWNEVHDDAGLILDGDPRRTAGAGGAQDARANAAIEIAATGAATDTPAPAVTVNLSDDMSASVRDALLPAMTELRDTATELREAMGITREAGAAVLTGTAASAQAIVQATTIAAEAATHASGSADALRDAVAALARPRKLAVTRDAAGRVTGSEEI